MKQSNWSSRSTARALASGRNRGHVPAMSLRALRRLGLVLLWAGTLVGIAYGLQFLERFARAGTSSGKWRLEWAGAPAGDDQWNWIRENIEQETAAYDLQSLHRLDLRDPNLCGRLAAALARSPWIAELERVSKRADGTISVHAQFRRYLTFVVYKGTGYLVDDTGVRLPVERPAGQLATMDMILVEGAREPAPPVGRPWAGEAVGAGLKLVNLLENRCPPNLLGFLKAVDVSNYKFRLNRLDGWLRIRTLHPDTPVLWGYTPGEESGGEATPARKLEYLWTIYSERGQIPDLGRPIDVRPKDAYLIRNAP